MRPNRTFAPFTIAVIATLGHVAAHPFVAVAQAQELNGGNLGAMAIGIVTHAKPAYAGQSYTEGYLTQPNVMGNYKWNRLSISGTVNLEAYTLKRGELNAGVYGEGYVDRRHPHTLVHEVMLSAELPVLLTQRLYATISAGKGFVPFGTDDPMVRPFVKYPVNHHHSQILERIQVVGALRYSQNNANVTIEAGVFNGDEPISPFSVPQWRRIADSWATRLTVRPTQQLEFQASLAKIESPDLTQGGGNDHMQHSASVRWSSPLRVLHAHSYLLAEVAHTDFLIDDVSRFDFSSVLIESSLTWPAVTAAIRFERTDRPEGERLLNPFRSPVGHIDVQLLGITRWSNISAQLSSSPRALQRLPGALVVSPLLEVTLSTPSAVIRPTVFEPEPFYGAKTLWSLSAGLRLHLGLMRERMGRYGAARSPISSTHAHH